MSHKLILSLKLKKNCSSTQKKITVLEAINKNKSQVVSVWQLDKLVLGKGGCDEPDTVKLTDPAIQMDARLVLRHLSAATSLHRGVITRRRIFIKIKNILGERNLGIITVFFITYFQDFTMCELER